MQNIGKAAFEQALSYNKTWTLMPVYAGDVDQSEAAKAWKSMKAVALNVMVASMARCMEEHGHDYAVEVWQIVEKQLMTANFHTRHTPIAIWSAIYKKASLRVEQQQPKSVGKSMASALDELMARSQTIAKGMTE